MTLIDVARSPLRAARRSRANSESGDERQGKEAPMDESMYGEERRLVYK
jgi:hypothetical protein